MKITLFILTLFLLFSCNKQENNTIQDFVEKYKNEDFSKFDNLYIGIRQSNTFETIYIISKSNFPPYFITQNNVNNKISINRNLLTKLNKKDYLNESQIQHYLDLFKKYNISSISVDENHNVYINIKENSVTLLRVNNINVEKNYKKIDEKWYIKK
ncbi:hypothetical protein NZD88_12010 [Chryseobacterium antibioticum]|uniref:DUF4252 domain-containing protein n=1 Tax=Chryseobacterium pyrolae TaxID=2987481 RepID=A0ABT2IHY7_9FLAO|nr:hypothetical protein [Chryseobacterium pyrolae]MCT2408268.1 hypothetical protein [Chryseobacterium pyrolae]